MPVRLVIRDLRLSHPQKPSQRTMGDLLGMTESNYRKLESNVLQSVKFKDLEKLVEFFDCPLEQIIKYVKPGTEDTETEERR